MTNLLDIIMPPKKVKMKVGLYFGSFNPVHIGHMAIANYMVEFSDIGQLWFVVSPHNPLKDKQSLLNDYDRLEMMRLAISDDPRFRVSDEEFRLPTPSYTIDTLNHLSNQYPNYEFRIIMGSDNLENFHLWRNYETIARQYKIMVYPRSGFDKNFISPLAEITFADAPLLDISSTFIRESVAAGKDMRYFVPDKVWKYMRKII
ncbi:MAG: nicotinate (nicotinamide) nucleotide adenylyltransferase [Prolixibacteraceae bacterium]|nr:nicotinate (nicotinamide) nucleotide adenylyltransferase [Prolixibacteraceae bacterium]